MKALKLDRNFYFIGIFFGAFLIAAGLFQGLIIFQLQEEIYNLPSIKNWFLLAAISHLIISLILLKYYHYKKYSYTFWTGLLSTTAFFCHFLVFYNLLLTREPSDYYITTSIISLGAGFPYGLSLIFSNAGKRPWLKSAGIFMLIYDSILLSTFIGSLYTQDIQLHSLLLKIHQWTAWAGSLFPLLLIMNFLSELKSLEPAGKPSAQQQAFNSFLALAGAATMVLTLVAGQNVSQEMNEGLDRFNTATKREELAAKPYEARIFVGKDGNKLPYRLLRPRDYDPAKKYPLVIHLHGGGGRGTDNAKQIYHGVFSHLLLNYGNREKYPSFIFVPQCPRNASWGETPYTPAMDSLVFEAISALEEEFNIDETRRYLIGASMGGYGTWHFIGTRPQMFAAAVPVCGGGDPELAPNMVEVPIWAFHGRQDELVPVSGSRDMIEAVRSAGGNPKYTEYPDKGHDLWEALNETPELMEWLFAQERE